MAFLVIRMWFGKAVRDFNKAVQLLGPVGPALVANTGNAFTSEFCAAYLSPDEGVFLPLADSLRFT